MAVPFIVLGGFDHASLFRVRNVSGFSSSPPAGAIKEAHKLNSTPYFWGGVYTHANAMRMVAARPGTERIVLTSIAPTCWEVVDGPSVRRFIIGSDALIHALP